MNNRDFLLEGRTESNAALQQLGPFRGSHFNSLGQFASKNPVPRSQILDHLNELFLGGPGKKQQKGMQESLHGGTMRESLAELETANY
jgi:hypothetical protein